MAKLLSVQVGAVQTMPAGWPDGQAWTSAIYKTSVDGPVYVGREGLEGDMQADRQNHGGPDRAVNFYPAEHYRVWHDTLGLANLPGGAFGENFTTNGLLEADVCIGDVFQVGEVVLEITQPRGPCSKLNRRWHVAQLMDLANESGRIGWYARVRQEGRVEAGQEIALVEHPNPEWPIARVWPLRMHLIQNPEIRALIEVPALSEDWRAMMQKKLPR
jgi:MOSC domain-containing protein YiiM